MGKRQPMCDHGQRKSGEISSKILNGPSEQGVLL